MELTASPAAVYARLLELHRPGAYGNRLATALWRARAAIDRVLGGPGPAAGPTGRLSPGDAFSMWLVADLAHEERMLLEARIRMPGRATLEFRIERGAPGRCTLHMLATLEPSHVLGRIYWMVMRPFHAFIFSQLASAIAHGAQQHEAGALRRRGRRGTAAGSP